MSRGDAKPIIRMKSINANKSQKLSGFFDYLTQPGHQTENNEIPEVYTNLEDSSAVGIKRFLDQYEKNFRDAMKSGDLKNNCKLLAKSMVFMLPHGMTKNEIDGYVKAISDALPDYMTFAFAVHRGSNKKTRDSHKNLHLQGFLGIRGNGAEKFGPEVRLPLHENLILAANDFIKSAKFKIAFNPVQTRPSKSSLKFLEAEAMASALKEGVSGNRALKTRQSELLRDSMWLLNFSKRDDIRDQRLKQFCTELAMKRININAEKFQKKPGLDLEFVSNHLNKTLKPKIAAETKIEASIEKEAMETVTLTTPQRLQPDRETLEQRTERRRQAQEAAHAAARREEIAEERAIEEYEERLRKFMEEITRINNEPTPPQQTRGLKL